LNKKLFLKFSSLKQVYVATNFGFLSAAISKLEKIGLTLNEQLSVLEDVQNKLSTVKGKLSGPIQSKYNRVLEKNKELNLVETIGAIINGDAKDVSTKYTVAEITSFKFAPLTSVDVERSFSKYNSLLRSNRQRLTLEHLTQMFCIYCNNHIN